MESTERNPSNNQGERYYGVGSFILEIVKVFILAFIIIVPIRTFLFQPFFVQGASMEPNFENNQYLIINELGYKQSTLSLGNQEILTVRPRKDLSRQVPIVFRYPKNHNQYFIKRVIGLPGEKLQIREGAVTIFNKENPEGFVLDESKYLSPTVRTTGELTIILKDDEYFVLGDNRPFSSDSRSWGPVKKADIIGTVILRAWPIDQVSLF